MNPAARGSISVLRVWGPLIFAAIVLMRQFGLVLAPVPVAVATARGSFAYAALAVIGTTAAAAIGIGDPRAAVAGFLAGSVGVPLGMWISVGTRYGVCVTRIAGMASAVMVSMLFATSASVEEDLRSAQVELERQVNEAGATDSESDSRVVGLQRWIVEHWPYLLPGFAVAMAACGACITVSLASRLNARAGGLEVPGRFRDMRPPEWLVWCGIAAAMLWFVDNERSNEVARFVSWNGAIALAGIYWLNGLGVFLTASVAFQWPVLLTAILLVLLLVPQTGPILAVAGFFDTWVEFRRRLKKKMGENESEDGGPPDIDEGE